MSRRGIIEATKPCKCKLCGAIEETRPYGPHGEEICFDCGMKNEQVTSRQFRRHVLGEGDA